MLELQKQFQNFIERHQLVKSGERILLAVSGGLDSMVMLELFHHSNYEIAVAHCNFGLRGEASDKDEAFVEQWTQERGIDCYVKQIVLNGKSIQVEAREERYKWFRELCTEKGFLKIATAHHLNDSLETTLLNLVRGTGIKGLSGIPVINEQIIRPLLFASRDEIHSYAMNKGLKWREDASNMKTDYDRNKIRLEVIPKLKEVNASLEYTFKNSDERLNLLSDLLQKQVAEVIQEYFDELEGQLGLKWIQEETDLLILYEILSVYGFNYVTVKEIWGARGSSGKVFEAKDWKVLMDRDSLFIQRNEQEEFKEVLIQDEAVYQVAEKELGVTILDNVVFEEFISDDAHEAILDYDKLEFPLKVRKWRQGDTFQPMGMKGTKKVSDLLIDEKVPIAKKEKVWILESNDEIAWVVGYRISEKFKVSGSSKKVVCLKLS